jgi:hypothetical protein
MERILNSGRYTGLTTQPHLTPLGTVAEQSVVAHRIVGKAGNHPCNGIADVHSAQDTIGHQYRCARQTPHSAVAGLDTIAEIPVTAQSIRGNVGNHPGHLVTGTHSAIHPVVQKLQ